MDDVRVDFLGPPHGTTPATVIANKNLNRDPLRAVNTFMRKGMGHTAVSTIEVFYFGPHTSFVVI